MTTIPASLLSANGDKWIRRSSTLLILIVGTSAGLLSWNGLTYLAVNSGVPAGLAWLLALAVDGMILLATAEILHASLTRRSTLFGWILSAFGVTLSIWGNTAAVSADGIQAAIVHGIAPVSLFLSVELFSRIVKHKISATQEALEQAQRTAEREAKRQAKKELGQGKGAGKAVKNNGVSVQAGTRGGSRIQSTDPEVADYKAVMDSLDEGSTKASKIEAVLVEYPLARNGHIAHALGVDVKSVATTIVRIRERLQPADKPAGQQDEGVVFQEIVKDFAPAGE